MHFLSHAETESGSIRSLPLLLRRLKRCLIEELISSEDNDEDQSFIVRLLPWRADRVYRLDKKQDKKVKNYDI